MTYRVHLLTVLCLPVVLVFGIIVGIFLNIEILKISNIEKYYYRLFLPDSQTTQTYYLNRNTNDIIFEYCSPEIYYVDAVSSYIGIGTQIPAYDIPISDSGVLKLGELQ